MRELGRIKEKFLHSNINVSAGVSAQYLNFRLLNLNTSITLVLCLEIIWGVFVFLGSQ